ncbi:phosphoribosylglycinamide formyltransferase-1 [Chryseolinea serpens]|uniref:Phosphoribosylglycinamide formyltransferase n=1 Tax=Chryseolinea serpens TaxID=947013 RepID=A0A1M5P9L6_9BACT|nr:phosphoribosylglycinamide formyltransferase [Chryseolinea serpens]SHG98442.1 phosphoribosylglycinamide formyltransferase-1 [Chryseolinea serpens]
MPKEFRIAIFASGSGTNAEEIMKHFSHHPRVEVVMLLSNSPEAYALKRAEKFNIPTAVFTRKDYKESQVVLEWLQQKQVTHVVLAGFLWLVPAYLTDAFPDRIINIHPSLLPKFGGKGMYGMKVHEAVKEQGEIATGITIHLVNEHYDEGRVIFQASCPVGPQDTPETIAQQVHRLEYAHYPRVIEEWVLGSA